MAIRLRATKVMESSHSRILRTQHAVSTYNDRLGLFERFFKWCMDPKREYLDASPAAGLTRLPDEWQEPEILTVDEIYRLFRAAEKIHCLQGCALSRRDAPLRFAPSNFLTMASYAHRSDEDAITSRGEADSLQLDPKFRPHSPRNARRQTSPRRLSVFASSTLERAHARTHRVSVLIVLS
jgi:hypothetical protein